MSKHRHHLSRRSFVQSAAAASAAGFVLPMGMTFAQDASPEPTPGGTLTYGNAKPAEPIINPINTIGTGQNVLIEPLYLRLVYGKQWTEGLNPPDEGDLEMAVAESMTEVEPDRVWEFKLRENVLWHDGTPVTADDVIFGAWLSNNRNVGGSNETPTSFLLGAEELRENGADVGDISIEGITKLDDYNIRIELDRAVPNYWKSWYVGYWPMPVHIYGEMPFDQLFKGEHATLPVGNGPFKAVNYVDGQYMEFEANEDFYLGRPLLDKYIVRFGDGDTLSAAIEAQEIDGTSVGAGPTYDRLASIEHIQGNPVPTSHPFGLIVNFERFPEHASGLNRAIMHAIDMDTINAQLFSNTLTPGNNLFSHMPGYEENPEGFQEYGYDPAAAQAILQEIGWDANTTLEWLIIGTPGTTQDAMQAMLAAVGIKTEYRPADAASAIDELYRNTNFDIVQSNFGPYDNFYDNWKYFKTDWSYQEGGFNYAHYSNPEVDALFEEGLTEPDAARQKEIFDEANLLLNQDPPQATLWRGATVYVWNRRVQGALPYQYREPVRPPFERVWIQQEGLCVPRAEPAIGWLGAYQ
jgi:peptide/nickel transport system substrate-binding protein